MIGSRQRPFTPIKRMDTLPAEQSKTPTIATNFKRRESVTATGARPKLIGRLAKPIDKIY